MDYPCMPQSADHKYYHGDVPHEVCTLCEYRDNLYDFIKKQYSHFTLLRCCEIYPDNVKHPEAIFVDRNNDNNTLAIEVKSLNKLYDKNRKKNDLITAKNYKFDSEYLNELDNKLAVALNQVLSKEKQLNPVERYLYFSFLIQHTHIHFTCDSKNKCTFKDIFMKIEKNEVGKAFNQLVKFFMEFYESIIKCLKEKTNGATALRWELMWEINKIEYAFNLEVFYTDEASAITWNDLSAHTEWCPNKEILSQYVMNKFQECEKKFSYYPDSRHVLLLKNESRYFTMHILEILNQLKRPKYIDEIWLSEYEHEEIYNDEGEFTEERRVGIIYKKVNIEK